MTWRKLCLLLMGLILSTPAFADGGRLRLSRTAGPFLVTLFTTPEPLTPGPVDFSVMVQDAKSGDILPDAQVTFVLKNDQRPNDAIHATATRGVATNRLMQAAEFNLPASGKWTVHVEVARAEQSAVFDTLLPVEQGSRKALLVWIFALLPVAALLLFFLHQRQKASLLRRRVPQAVADSE